jgi:hypothetical protein
MFYVTKKIASLQKHITQLLGYLQGTTSSPALNDQRPKLKLYTNTDRSYISRDCRPERKSLVIQI